MFLNIFLNVNNWKGTAKHIDICIHAVKEGGIHMCVYVLLYMYVLRNTYGVATSSRLLIIIGLFCRISSLL